MIQTGSAYSRLRSTSCRPSTLSQSLSPPTTRHLAHANNVDLLSRSQSSVLPSPAPSDEASSPPTISTVAVPDPDSLPPSNTALPSYSPSHPQAPPPPPPTDARPCHVIQEEETEENRDRDPRPCTLPMVATLFAAPSITPTQAEAGRPAGDAGVTGLGPSPPRQPTELWARDLELMIESLGGKDAADPVYEIPRYNVVRAAVTEGDFFFLLVHEVVCLRALDSARVNALLGLPNAVVESACQILEGALRPTARLRFGMIHWYADFPFGLKTHEFPADGYLIPYRISLCEFFGQLSQKWPSLVNAAASRRTPVRVWELVEILKIRSGCLLGIFFRMSRRLIGVKDGPKTQGIIHALEANFTCDRNLYFNKSLTDDERHIASNEVELRYQQLMATLDNLSLQDMPNSKYLSQSRHNKSLLLSSSNHTLTVFEGPALGSLQQGQHPQPRHQLGGHPAAVSLPTQVPPTYQPIYRPSPPRQGNHSIAPGISPISQPPSSYHQTAAPYSPTTLLSNVPPGQLVTSPGMPSSPHPLPPLRPPLQQPPHHSNPQSASGIPSQPSQLWPSRGTETQRAFAAASNVYSPGPQSPVAIAPPSAVWATSSSNPTNSASARLQPPVISPAQAMQPLPSQPATNYGGHQAPHQSGPHFAHAVQPASSQPGQPQHGPQRGQQARNLNYPFLPPASAIIPPMQYPHVHTMMARRSLHMLETMSPPRRLRKLGSQDVVPVPHERYYQYVGSCLARPTQLSTDGTQKKLKFQILPQIHATFSRVVEGIGKPFKFAEYYQGSSWIRFRICEAPSNIAILPEGDWLYKPTVWPSALSIKINEDGYPQVARKENFGKARPCDITSFVRVDRNELSVVILPSSHNSNASYFGAVELIVTASHSSIMRIIQEKKRLAEKSTLDVIKSRLSICSVDGDDEGEVLADQELCISLTDPFSTTRVKVPCRGVDCRHLDPFDLSTWLETRPSKDRCAHGLKDVTDCAKCAVYGVDWQEPSLVDTWKCPICSADARPNRLVVDGFLQGVVDSLEKQGLNTAKVIYVNAEGKWRPKEELPDDEDEGSDGDEGPALKRHASDLAKKKVAAPQAEVVVIDDD